MKFTKQYLLTFVLYQDKAADNCFYSGSKKVNFCNDCKISRCNNDIFESVCNYYGKLNKDRVKRADWPNFLKTIKIKDLETL